MGRLDGKVALVSGAGRGIGAETARTLAAEGARIVITEIDEGLREAIGADLRDRGIDGLVLAHDVRNEDDWVRVVDQAVDRFGGLDILVNNAGVYMQKSIEEMSLEDWRWLSAINLEGVFLGTKQAIRVMKLKGGSIVNLSSVAGLIGSAFSSAYNMSKGGVRLFTKSTAIECAQLGYPIRCNSVHPAVIQTDMGELVFDKYAEMTQSGRNQVVERVQALHPIGRLGEARDIANAILFLASDDSAFMTGAELVVDGGYTAR